MKCEHLNYQFKSIDIEVSGKNGHKSIVDTASIPRHESIADSDIVDSIDVDIDIRY